MSPTNKYPDLPTVIDIGGDLYDMRADQDVELSHKSRDTFFRTFHPRTYGSLPVEYLLRKYLPVGQKIDEIIFTVPSDYDNFMKILRRRAQQLSTSQQFSSQVVKNITIRRYHARILEIMEELRRKKTVKKKAPRLSENEIFHLILEIAWYLSHPGEIPAIMEKEWKFVMDALKDQRLSDILETIRQVEKEKGLSSEEHPLQYFKKIDMDDAMGADTLAEAMGRVKNMTTLVNATPIRPDMSQRLRNLMNVLSLKGYVDETAPKNEQGIPMLDRNKLFESLLENPMKGQRVPTGTDEKTGTGTEEKTGTEVAQGKKKRVRFNGGAVSTLAVPLGQAMLPVFRYLRMLFDPIYSILEQATTSSVKRAVLPHLLQLLHLCNEFNTPVARLEFGLYHIKNIPDTLITFLTEQLDETTQHLAEMKSDTERSIFQQQLFHLPKVRLRSLIRNNGGVPTMTDSLHSVFHIQFFIVGQNLTIPDETDFKKKNPKVDSKVLDTLRQEFLPNSVFLAYTDASTTSENIPIRTFEVDYDTITVNQTGVKVSPFSSKMDSLEKDGLLKSEDAYLDRLLTIQPYTVYNDAELALSVLMALKERMPK